MGCKSFILPRLCDWIFFSLATFLFCLFLPFHSHQTFRHFFFVTQSFFFLFSSFLTTFLPSHHIHFFTWIFLCIIVVTLKCCVCILLLSSPVFTFWLPFTASCFPSHSLTHLIWAGGGTQVSTLNYIHEARKALKYSLIISLIHL